MPRKLILATMIAISAGTLLAWASRAAEEPNEDATKAFMRAKLDAAQDVLEGLVTEDFKKIKDGADQMNVMSQKAEWNVLQTPQYRLYSGEFQRLTEELARAATEQKVDASTLAYVQLTLSCVNCHRHVRGAKIALNVDLRNAQLVAASEAFTLPTR